ncbi:hypothetical protein A6J71_11530 [Enterobacter cancerogenus]|nr:hypothetical protein A6J71_11530 [Enterobacter cancerogenus]
MINLNNKCRLPDTAILACKTLNAALYGLMVLCMWMFATNLDDAPQLLEKFSQLRDIGKRISTDDEIHVAGR